MKLRKFETLVVTAILAMLAQSAYAESIAIHGYVFAKNFVKTSGSYMAVFPPPYELDFDLVLNSADWITNSSDGLRVNNVGYGTNFTYSFEGARDLLLISSLEPSFRATIAGVTSKAPSASVEGYYNYGLFLSYGVISKIDVLPAPAPAVPEPKSYLLLLAGLVATAAHLRWSRTRSV